MPDRNIDRRPIRISGKYRARLDISYDIFPHSDSSRTSGINHKNVSSDAFSMYAEFTDTLQGRRNLIIHLLFSARSKLCRADYLAIYIGDLPPLGNPIYRRARFPSYLGGTSKLIPSVLPLRPLARLKTYPLHLPDIPPDIDEAKRALNAFAKDPSSPLLSRK